MKEQKINFSADSLDFDFDLGDPFGATAKPKDWKDHVKSFGKGFGTGASITLTNPRMLGDVVSRLLPDGYGSGVAALVDTAEALGRLYDVADKEIQKTTRSLKSFTRTGVDLLGDVLPEKTKQRLKDFSKFEPGHSGYSEQELDNQALMNFLGEGISSSVQVAAQAESNQSKRDAYRDQISVAQHQQTFGQLDAIRQANDRLVAFHERVTFNYQRKNLELGFRQNLALTRLLAETKYAHQTLLVGLDKLIETSATPEMVKLSNHEQTRSRWGGRGASGEMFGSRSNPIRGIANRIQERGAARLRGMRDSFTSALVQGEMGAAGLSMAGSPSAAGGTLAGTFLPGILAQQIGRKTRGLIDSTERGRRWGRKIQFGTSNIEQILRDPRGSQFGLDDYNEDGSVKMSARLNPARMLREFLRSNMGDNRESLMIENDSLGNIQQPVPFTRHVAKSITEVIPGLLSRILQQSMISNGAKGGLVEYDYTRNSFTTRESSRANALSAIRDQSGTENLRYSAKALVDEVGGNLNEEDKRVLALRLAKDNYNKKLGSAERMMDVDTYSDLPADQAERIANAFKGYFQSDEEGEKELRFNRSYNRLGDGIMGTQNMVQNYVRAGLGDMLTQEGLLKDGMIDADKLIELYMSEGVKTPEPKVDPESGKPVNPGNAQAIVDAMFTKATEFKDGISADKLIATLEKIQDKGREVGDSFKSNEQVMQIIEQVKDIDPRTPEGRAQLQEVIQEVRRKTTKSSEKAKGWFESMRGKASGFGARVGPLAGSVGMGAANLFGLGSITPHLSGIGSSIGGFAAGAGKELKSGLEGVSDNLADRLDKLIDLTTEELDITKARDKMVDGVRKGSAKDIFRERAEKDKEKKKEKEEKDGKGKFGLASLLGGLGALFNKGRGLFGGGGGDEEESDGDTYVYAGDGGGDKDEKKKGRKGKKGAKGRAPVKGGRFGRIGSIARAGGRGLASAGRFGATMLASGLGSMLPGGSMVQAAGARAINGGLGLGARLAGGALRMGGGLLLRGAGALLGGPIGIGIAAASLAIPAIGMVWDWATSESINDLDKVRLAQYGFKPDDKENFAKMRALEEVMLGATAIDSEGTAKIDKGSIKESKVQSIFETDKMDQNQLQDFGTWFGERFIPIFIIHVTMANRFAKVKDPYKVSDASADKQLPYLEAVRFSQGPYNVRQSPVEKPNPLPMGLGEIDLVYTEVRNKIVPKAKKDTEKSVQAEYTKKMTEFNTAAGLAAQAGVKNEMEKPDYNKMLNERMEDNRRVLEQGRQGAGAGSGAGMTTELPELAVDRSTMISALDAIRFKLYGLKEMEAEKISMIERLEKGSYNDLQIESETSIRWTGSISNMVNKFAASFGVADTQGDEGKEWVEWFKFRFLPVFTTTTIYLHARLKREDIDSGIKAIKPNQALEMANILLGVTTTQDSKVSSVWGVVNSPWPGYEVNTDAATVKGNLEILKESAQSFKLDEQNKQARGATKVGQNPSGGPRKAYTPDADDDYGDGVDKIDPTGSGGQGTRAATGFAGGQGQIGTGAAGAIPTLGAMAEGTGGNVDGFPASRGDGYKNNLELIEAVGKAAGVNPVDLAAFVAVESDFRAGVKNQGGASSATGFGQFVEKTWGAVTKQYGGKYGITPSTPRTNPAANLLMTAEYYKENVRGLKRAYPNRTLSLADAYLAHHMGLGGAKKLLDADPNALAANVLPDSAKSNRNVFFHENGKPRTVAELLDHVRGMISNKARVHNVPLGGDGSAGSREIGEYTAGAAGTAIPGTPGGGQIPATTPPTTEAGFGSVGGGIQPINTNYGLPPGAGAGGGGSSSVAPLLSGGGYAGSINTTRQSNTTGTALGNEVTTAANGTELDRGAKSAGNAGETVTLVREPSQDYGTFGIMTLPDGTRFHTLELPWRDNAPQRSCIPGGTYPAAIKNSPRFGTVYRVNNVPNRSEILIHAGNTAGDKAMGMKADVLGCILLGMGRGKIGNQPSVTSSKDAVKLFMEKMGHRDFKLVITGQGDSGQTGVPDDGQTPGLSQATGAVPTPASSSMGFSDTNPYTQQGAGGSAIPVSDSSAYSGFGVQATPEMGQAANRDPVVDSIDTTNNLLLDGNQVRREILLTLIKHSELLEGIVKISGSVGAPSSDIVKDGPNAGDIDVNSARYNLKKTPTAPVRPLSTMKRNI